MILLAVTGSIAAYKAAELLRLLLKRHHDVRVVMTESATRFVGPLTFQALSGAPVLTDLLDPRGWEMAHLELSAKASAMIVAPASAETISRLARGSAGDVVTASALSMPRDASGKLSHPVFIVPAMHQEMWQHPATQANVKALSGFGYDILGPEHGDLGRVGDQGVGRMMAPESVMEHVLKKISS